MTDIRPDYWQKKLQSYSEAGWADKPSLFVQDAVKFFPPGGSVLELGAGYGQDGAWLASKGYEVTMADLTLIPYESARHVKATWVCDMEKPLPFPEEIFDVIYSHQALHYFTLERTEALFEEIFQRLKPGGIFAFIVNSTADPEVDAGQEIEPNFRKIKDINKRFFNLELTRQLTSKYEVLLLDDHGTSYKDHQDGLVHLIRFVGRKK